MSPSPDPAGVDIAALEDVAARAVPAAEIAEIGGWLARYTPRVGTRRPNSVLARAGDPDDVLSERIAAVERFYAERDLPARFQLTSASRPADIERMLRERGYARESPTRVYVGEATAVVAHHDLPGRQVTVDTTPGRVWFSTWCEAFGIDPDRQAGSVALWTRITTRCAFALITDGDVPVGVGMGVTDGEWVGIFNMATVAPARRRGVARTTLRELARWGLAHGAHRAYLQVDVANRGAQALYAAAGFTHAYDYAYLVRR